ncbi:protein of unknown function (plasmid) [Cupriavidus taiwanensis]|uniref:Uncharacterized protein n=1 Tax=Cupriavidus taiwanensis TaxID=164546 RepID=A0A9Q7V1L0_9BURK|nr:protein of unknown function [Cupriavidus taiwanensis]
MTGKRSRTFLSHARHRLQPDGISRSGRALRMKWLFGCFSGLLHEEFERRGRVGVTNASNTATWPT